MGGFAKHEPVWLHRFQYDVAQMVSRKLAEKRFEIARDCGLQLVDEAPAMKSDDVSLVGRRLLFTDTHRVPPPLVVGNPFDPVRNRHVCAHLNAFPVVRFVFAPRLFGNQGFNAVLSVACAWNAASKARTR